MGLASFPGHNNSLCAKTVVVTPVDVTRGKGRSDVVTPVDVTRGKAGQT